MATLQPSQWLIMINQRVEEKLHPLDLHTGVIDTCLLSCGFYRVATTVDVPVSGGAVLLPDAQP